MEFHYLSESVTRSLSSPFCSLTTQKNVLFTAKARIISMGKTCVGYCTGGIKEERVTAKKKKVTLS